MDMQEKTLAHRTDKKNTPNDEKDACDNGTFPSPSPTVTGAAGSTAPESAEKPIGNADQYLPAAAGTRTGANPGVGGMDRSRGWGQDGRSNNTMGENNVQTDIPGNKNG